MFSSRGKHWSASQGTVLIWSVFMWLTYVQNPNDPYQVKSGKTNMVDYVQFPRETLERKSGDCVDLVGFYVANLCAKSERSLSGEIGQNEYGGLCSVPEGNTGAQVRGLC